MKLGIYKHFKGELYEVLDIVTHTETLEELVIYKSLKNNKKLARSKKMFLEQINKPQYNYKGPRFYFIESN